MNMPKQSKMPSPDCALCPRLQQYRDANQAALPDKFNAPVPSFGDLDAQLLIVGLAPGLKGANFTGRPFTGDYAGDLLYATLLKHGFATGKYEGHKDDSVTLLNCRITNAVRCVPPENKPTTDEMKSCQPFLIDEIAAMRNLKIMLALGKIAHDSVLRNFGLPLSSKKFAHAARHDLPNGLTLVNSYHCSRYNTQTGRLDEEMFGAVFEDIKKYL